MPPALALLAVLAAAPVEVRTDVVDAARTEAGLRARAGDAIDDWQIVITPGPDPASVAVVVEGPDGSVRRRPIALAGETVEDRSRELAASLALLLDQPGDRPRPEPQQPADPPLPPEPPTGPDEPPPPRPTLRGWVALGPRVEFGTGLRFEADADLMGGLWLVREHVQPIASLGVGGGAGREIAVVHTRVGGGAAFGAPLALQGRIWLGGHVLAHALFVRARQAGVDSTWLSSTELGALLQYRGRRLLVGVRSGVDLTLPPVSIRGARGALRRGPVRWLFGVTVGVVFG